MATVDGFLELDGVKGESTDAKHKDKIEIHSFQWGVHSASNMATGGGGGVGKAVFSDFTVTKKVDLASPVLAKFAATGEHIAKGKVIFRKAGGSAGQQDYQTYDFEKIYVTGLAISGGQDGEFYETLTLSPTKFKWEYKKQGDKGSLEGNTVVTVDRAKNTTA